jgi:hypothetical protein
MYFLWAQGGIQNKDKMPPSLFLDGAFGDEDSLQIEEKSPVSGG